MPVDDDAGVYAVAQVDGMPWLANRFTVAERQLITRALSLATRAHAGQVRDEGTPFINHPLAVAEILVTELDVTDAEVIAAAICHDALEDCNWLDEETLSDGVGARAARIVVDVTKPPAEQALRAERDRLYMLKLATLPPDSLTVKIADRIHNLRSVVDSPDRAKARRYLDVSRAEFVPLAARVSPAASAAVSAACDAIARHLEQTQPCDRLAETDDERRNQ